MLFTIEKGVDFILVLLHQMHETSMKGAIIKVNSLNGCGMMQEQPANSRGRLVLVGNIVELRQELTVNVGDFGYRLKCCRNFVLRMWNPKVCQIRKLFEIKTTLQKLTL